MEPSPVLSSRLHGLSLFQQFYQSDQSRQIYAVGFDWWSILELAAIPTVVLTSASRSICSGFGQCVARYKLKKKVTAPNTSRVIKSSIACRCLLSMLPNVSWSSWLELREISGQDPQCIKKIRRGSPWFKHDSCMISPLKLPWWGRAPSNCRGTLSFLYKMGGPGWRHLYKMECAKKTLENDRAPTYTGDSWWIEKFEAISIMFGGHMSMYKNKDSFCRHVPGLQNE